MQSFFKSLLPYGIIRGNFHLNIKKWIKNILPAIIVEIGIKKNRKKHFTSEYLKKNYVSDLTENEKWSILAIVLLLERKQRQVNYLEIGVYAGGTIRFLKDNSDSASFTGIDLFEDFKQTKTNTHLWENYTIEQVSNALGKERVNLFKGDSVNVLKYLLEEGKKFDIIFIDGNHTYSATKNDFDSAVPLLKINGYIIFHNCSPGLTQEDKSYIIHDGGPWLLTIELLDDNRFRLIEVVDRVKIFKFNYS